MAGTRCHPQRWIVGRAGARDAGKDLDFDGIDPTGAEDEYDQLVDEQHLADAAVVNASLDDTFMHGGETYALRFVYLHMIGEYARHNGHADIVRERPGGATGF